MRIEMLVGPDLLGMNYCYFRRCVEMKIEQTMEKALERVDNSDLRNADYLLDTSNTNFDQCFYLSNPND
jgi:hypothetical protein